MAWRPAARRSVEQRFGVRYAELWTRQSGGFLADDAEEDETASLESTRR